MFEDTKVFCTPPFSVELGECHVSDSTGKKVLFFSGKSNYTFKSEIVRKLNEDVISFNGKFTRNGNDIFLNGYKILSLSSTNSLYANTDIGLKEADNILNSFMNEVLVALNS